MDENFIKPEYVIKDHERVLSIDCVADNDKNKFSGGPEESGKRKQNEDDPDGDSNRRRKKIKFKGQNKSRKPFNPLENTASSTICSRVADSTRPLSCTKTNCPFLHDVKRYLEVKPPDLGATCYVYDVRGYCPWGVACRFSSSHFDAENGVNLVDEGRRAVWDSSEPHVLNGSMMAIQVKLRKKQYDLSKSENVISAVDKLFPRNNEETPELTDSDGDLVKLRDSEKKKIDWTNKLYLSPLTTLGNLPFRRICKEYGADVTCGEMALATVLLQGETKEWSLVKRHESEDLFGVQIAGSNPHVMTKAAQVLQENCSLDFIDVNLGCPIDDLYRQGIGSGMLQRTRVLKITLNSMSRVLDIPLTVKTRMGASSKQPVARELMPSFREAGVSLVTVHGRSREQRYTKTADWDYVEQCARAADPLPVFGNGDVISYCDYEKLLETCPTVKGVMIGRGALMKPWIFQELKQRKHLDPTSSERLDILKKFVHYGLEHWGSDTRGVETTRRFLLEWLSFLCRYVPVGLIIAPPQRVNTRPPFYRGRDDLETLMGSPNCLDWIKISEMLLGPVPEGFKFLPKHKANAWK